MHKDTQNPVPYSCAPQLLLGVFESRETIVVVEDSYMGNSLLSTLSHFSL
ncbi:MAG: hypothetical protein HXN19_03545 [Porphyromonas sp.]|nr:hypothetical protein [Porphyromonas sp.]